VLHDPENDIDFENMHSEAERLGIDFFIQVSLSLSLAHVVD
jgi:hypothetical protein